MSKQPEWIKIYKNALTKEQCENVINFSKERFFKQPLLSGKEGRTSSQFFIEKGLEVVSEMTFDLVETESEKLKELAEGVDFTGDVEDYKEKISVIKESYFGGNPTSTHDDVEEDAESVQDLTESMSIYTAALTRSVK